MPPKASSVGPRGPGKLCCGSSYSFNLTVLFGRGLFISLRFFLSGTKELFLILCIVESSLGFLLFSFLLPEENIDSSALNVVNV